MIREAARGLLGRKLWARASVARAMWIGRPRELHWIRKLTSGRVGTAIDVGANYGIYTRPLSLWASHVVAFEPLAALRRALATDVLENVRVEGLAVGDFNGTLRIRVPTINGRSVSGLATAAPANDFSSEIVEQVDEVEVPCVTLDSYFREQKPSTTITFMKIDVEGYEQNVLTGASKLLERFRPTLLVEIEMRHGANPLETFAYLSSLGYSAFWIDDEDRLIATDGENVTSLQANRVWQEGRLVDDGRVYPNNFFFLPPTR